MHVFAVLLLMLCVMCVLVVLVCFSFIRKDKNSEVSYTVKVTSVCSSAQCAAIAVDATKTTLLVVESTQGRFHCPQVVKGKTYGVAVNLVSSSPDLYLNRG